MATLDIEQHIPRVQDFIASTVLEFTKRHGRASVVRLDVQAVHGQIHVYPSVTHTSETIYEDIGKPVDICFDEDSWSDDYYDGKIPSYRGRIYDPDCGDADYNEVFSMMIYDAALKAIESIPSELAPKEVLVEAAIESGGTYAKIITPETKG